MKSCWLLNAQFVKYGKENISIGFPKAFFVAAVQSVMLFIVLLIFSAVLIGGLMSLGSRAK